MAPIRILLLDTGKEWGGGTNSMIELLKRIDRTKFDVTALFYHHYAKGEDSDLRTELGKIGVPLAQLTVPIAPLWARVAKEFARALLFWSRSFRAKLLFEIERRWRIQPMATRLAKVVQDGKYQLLYLNNQPSSNLEGYLAAHRAGVPVVQHARIVSRLNRSEARIVNQTAVRVICVSQGVKDELVKQGVKSERCEVVFNGIDINQLLPEQELSPSTPLNRTIRIGTIGQLAARKYTEHVLEAAALLRDQGSTLFEIHIVGSGPRRKFLEAEVSRLTLSEHVMFSGFLSKPFGKLAALDIFVLSSLEEGFPRVILEAMLMGKPVVASRVAGSSELVRHGETGFLYEFGDTKALAQFLDQLSKDENLRTRMGAAGKAVVVREYSIERYVTGVERILTEAAEVG